MLRDLGKVTWPVAESGQQLGSPDSQSHVPHDHTNSTTESPPIRRR